MMDIRSELNQLFSATELAAYYQSEKAATKPYLGEALFPPVAVLGRELKQVKGRAGVPVALRTSKLDTAAPVRAIEAVAATRHEMPFFRESARIDEALLMELVKALPLGREQADPAIRPVYESLYGLIRGADAAAERMRMQLISTGSISILDDEDDVSIEADYGFDAESQTVTLDEEEQWDKSETCDPMRDIYEVIRTRAAGSAMAIMTQNTFRKLLAAGSVKALMPAASSLTGIVTPGMAIDWALANYGVRIVALSPRENSYSFEWDRQDVKTFFPDGVVSIVPDDGALGATCYGSTPEGITAEDAAGDAQTAIVNTGVAIRTYQTAHMVNINTVVSQTVMPSFARIGELCLIKAYDPS